MVVTASIMFLHLQTLLERPVWCDVRFVLGHPKYVNLVQRLQRGCYKLTCSISSPV
jgi:hypothetical protein